MYRQLFLGSVLISCQMLAVFCISAKASGHYSAIFERIIFKYFNPDIRYKYDRVELLRPIGYAHQHEFKKKSYVNADFNSNDMFANRAKIITVDKYKLVQSKKNNQYAPVTGIFVHQAANIKTWRFIDEKNHITTVNATDNHPFYVKNLRTFLPVKDITPQMLLSADGHSIHLLCHDKFQCGKPFSSNAPVYDIEVKKRHVYFIGKDKILVHNCAVSNVVERENGRIADTMPLSAGYKEEKEDVAIKKHTIKQKKRTFNSERHGNLAGEKHEGGKQYITVKISIPCEGNGNGFFTVAVRKNKWYFSGLPEDLGSNSLCYSNLVIDKLTGIRSIVGEDHFYPECVTIDFGKDVMPHKLNDDFFKSSTGEFFKTVLLKAYGGGQLDISSVPVRQGNASKICFNVSRFCMS